MVLVFHLPLLEIVGPHLRDAVDEIGDTGFLTRRTGHDTVCVARQLGTYPIQVLAWNVGERRPLGVTNAGIAILSGMQTESVRRILVTNRLRLARYGLSTAEILQDVRLFTPDLSEEAIVAGLMQLKSAALLAGWRGAPRLDVAALARLIRRVSAVLLAEPGLRELDLNPVILHPEGEGLIVLDALILTA